MSVLNTQFEAEVLPHLPKLHQTALRLKKNKMDADDLVQETLLRALRFWNRFTPGTNCKAWLFRILHNQNINEWRATSKMTFTADIDRVPEDVLARTMPVQDHAFEKNINGLVLDNDLRLAIDQLQNDFGRIVFLFHICDLPYRKIARLTGLSLGTVKSRLYRGRQLLRRSLSEYAIDNRYVTRHRH